MTSDRSFTSDLLESFRWMADVAVMEAFESRVLDLPDFYFTADDYRYCFEIEAKRRFLDLLRERFNTSNEYKGRNLKWDTVIEQKAVELGRYLVNRSAELDLSRPSPRLRRMDTLALRNRIFSLSQSEAYGSGIGRLHYTSAKQRGKRTPVQDLPQSREKARP